MKIAYFDCFAGAGGDMITASLLDAGLEEQFLHTQLASLNIPGLEINISRTHRCGIKATRFEPTAVAQPHGRSVEQVVSIIEKSSISSAARDKSIRIVNRLGSAEARVHGKDARSIHFHELGDVDAIVDIVSACVGLEQLGIERVYCSQLRLGGGVAQCRHGILPAPAPATLELVRSVPVVGGPEAVELLTPTAAAILTELVDEFGALPAMQIEVIGYGAGSIESERFPNVLRVIVGTAAGAAEADVDCVCVLEATSDDTTGETIGFVTETLLENGALDAFTAPIYMKHNRPAVQITVICRPADSARIEQILFEQGVTFGIRKQLVQRSRLARDFVAVQTQFGSVRIKMGLLNGKVVAAKPEFGDCTRAAQEHGVPVRAVLEAASRAFRQQSQDTPDKA